METRHGNMVSCDPTASSYRDTAISKACEAARSRGTKKPWRTLSNQRAGTHCSAKWRRAHTSLRSLRRPAISTDLLPSRSGTGHAECGAWYDMAYGAFRLQHGSPLRLSVRESTRTCISPPFHWSTERPVKVSDESMPASRVQRICKTTPGRLPTTDGGVEAVC